MALEGNCAAGGCVVGISDVVSSALNKNKKECIMDINKCVVYDVEVVRGPEEVEGGWDNPEAMEFASAVAYSYEHDHYFFYLHHEEANSLMNLLQGKRAVSFNGIKFDSRVLLGNDREADSSGRTGLHGRWWDNYDILLDYVKSAYGCKNVLEAEKKLGDKAIHDGSFGLDGLAEGTLGLRKTGHGSMAPALYRDRRYKDLLAYNFQDTRLTKLLFDFIRIRGYVVNRNRWVVQLNKWGSL